MISLFAIVGLGFLLGMRHATDPDHVIAVTTIVSRERSLKQAGFIGVVWGIGHTLTIVAVGAAMILFRIVLPPRLGLSMELAVAVMLIALGLWNMGPLFGLAGEPRRMAASAAGDDSPHEHRGHTHSHLGSSHTHDIDAAPLRWFDRVLGKLGLYQLLRPLVVGIVHGLAGSAAIALLVLSTIQSLRWAVAYLIVFGFGTIIGMMLITLTIASTFSFGQKRFAGLQRHFGMATGMVSLAFGLFIAYQIGFVNGLFTGHVHWIPR